MRWRGRSKRRIHSFLNKWVRIKVFLSNFYKILWNSFSLWNCTYFLTISMSYWEVIIMAVLYMTSTERMSTCKLLIIRKTHWDKCQNFPVECIKCILTLYLVLHTEIFYSYPNPFDLGNLGTNKMCFVLC